MRILIAIYLFASVSSAVAEVLTELTLPGDIIVTLKKEEDTDGQWFHTAFLEKRSGLTTFWRTPANAKMLPSNAGPTVLPQLKGIIAAARDGTHASVIFQTENTPLILTRQLNDDSPLSYVFSTITEKMEFDTELGRMKLSLTGPFHLVAMAQSGAKKTFQISKDGLKEEGAQDSIKTQEAAPNSPEKIHPKNLMGSAPVPAADEKTGASGTRWLTATGVTASLIVAITLWRRSKRH